MYINHLSVIELLEKIRERHTDSVIPISIFLDNVKYQVCKAVTERVAALNNDFKAMIEEIKLFTGKRFSSSLWKIKLR